MALVHPDSCECSKPELGVFGLPPTQGRAEEGYWEHKGVTSSLTDQGPYEFAVRRAGDEYLDLAKRNPAAFLFLGDNVYIDKPTHRNMQRLYYYRRQLRPEFQQLSSSSALLTPSP